MQLTTLSLGVASLAGLAAAAAHPRAHPRHMQHHAKRDLVVETVTDDVVVTDTVTDVTVVTVPAGEPSAAPASTSSEVATVESISAALPATSAVASTTVVPPTTLLTATHKSKHHPSSHTTIVSVPTTTSSVAAVSTVTPVSESSVTPSSTVVESSSTVVSVSSVASATSTSVSSSSGKRGLAFNEADLTSGFQGSSEVSWAYNWASSTSDLSDDFEYIPMLWGLDSSATDEWASAASSAIAAGSSHLLGFNEPDLSTQSNIDYTTAAEGYKTYMEPFAGQAKLGGPAVTNGASPMGLTYLENFLSECSDCTIDFIPIHWYDSATNYDYFKEYIEEAYAAGGNRTLWITEFGASGSDDEQVTFLENVMPWLDSLDYVERYAYFMCSDGSLLSSGSTLSDIGTTFSSYTSSTIASVMES